MSSVGFAVHISRVLQRDIFRKCREFTHQMFNKYLLLTNIGVSASLSLTGDLIEQYYEIFEEKHKSFDKGRAFRMTVAGITGGAICHYWYLFLDKKFPQRSIKIVLKKVAIDQVVFSPIFISLFFVTTCTLERATFEEFKEEVIQKGWKLYLAEWVIWPPAQVINFYFLPTRFRVLYDNMISLGYDIYTSYVKNEIHIEKNEKSKDGENVKKEEDSR